MCICVAGVSLGAAYLLIKISISLFALCVCLFQQPVKMVAAWLAGWLVRLFEGFLFVDDVGRGDCVLALSFFLWSEREREIVKASRQHVKLQANTD